MTFGSTLRRLLFAVAAIGGESLVEKTATGNPATFTTGVAMALTGLTVPISSEGGLTGANIYHTGKNLFKTTATSKEAAGVTYTVNADGTITVSGTASGYSDLGLGECVLPPAGKIIVSGIESMTNIVWDGVRILDGSKTALATLGAGSRGNQTFNLADYPTAKYVRLTVKRSSNVATSGTIKPQVEIAETVSEYEQYSGSVSTVTFGETVNTGSLDAITGVLTVTAPESKTINLDPVSITTVTGTNHVWTDTGGTNTVKYMDNP